MTAPTADAIKTVLDDVNDYPYPIVSYTYQPKFHLYPYIVIRKTPPIQLEKTITTETIREGFDITYYIRYTRKQEDEEKDQLLVENIIIRELEKIDFGTQALYLETKNWQRTAIPRIYGSQSKLAVLVVDKASVSGQGIFGSQTTMTLPSGQSIQLLALSSTEGAQLDTHEDDVGLMRRDFSGIEQGDFTVEYESTSKRDTEIRTISEAFNEVQITLKKGTASRDLNVLFGLTTKRGQFDTIERANTRFTIQSVVTATRLCQVSVDAILVN